MSSLRCLSLHARPDRFPERRPIGYETITPMKPATPPIAGPASGAPSGAAWQERCRPARDCSRKSPAGSTAPPSSRYPAFAALPQSDRQACRRAEGRNAMTAPSRWNVFLRPAIASRQPMGACGRQMVQHQGQVAGFNQYQLLRQRARMECPRSRSVRSIIRFAAPFRQGARRVRSSPSL